MKYPWAPYLVLSYPQLSLALACSAFQGPAGWCTVEGAPRGVLALQLDLQPSTKLMIYHS